MFEYLKGKKVLITGCGTLAWGLAKELTCEVAIYSRNEAAQFKFTQEYPCVKAYLGDIQDKIRFTHVVRDFKPNIIIHTAAVKRVDVAENEPVLTTKNNILGTLNVGEVALNEGVEAVIGIGTDKEVDSKTVYGDSKKLSNLCLLDLDRLGDTKFSIVRYGNIFGSRSSVGVIWQEAAAKNEAIRITNPDMTRFFFVVSDAVRLIDYGLNKTLNQNGHGKIYSTEMCMGTLDDLATAIINLTYSKSEKQTVGLRVSAEKLHESLISERELQDTIRTSDVYKPCYTDAELHYFVTTPGSKKSNISTLFTSDVAPKLTIDQLKDMVQHANEITFKD